MRGKGYGGTLKILIKLHFSINSLSNFSIIQKKLYKIKTEYGLKL